MAGAAIGLVKIKRWDSRNYLNFLIFTATIGFTAIAALFQGFPIQGLIYAGRWLLYILFYMVFNQAVRHHYLSVSIRGLLQFIGYGLLLGGIGQYLFLPDTRFLQYQGWDDHYYRMIGTLYDPNFFGLLMVLAALFIWFKESGKQRLVLMTMAIAAIAATYSRLSWLTAGIAGFFTHPRKALLGIAASALIIAALPKPGGEGINLFRSYSIISRWESVVEGWNIFLSHPITGIGFNNYPAVAPKTGKYNQPFHATAPDNSFVFILATAGGIGGLAFIFLLASLFRTHSSALARLSLLAIILHSMGNNSFFYPWVLMWLFLILTLKTSPESLG